VGVLKIEVYCLGEILVDIIPCFIGPYSLNGKFTVHFGGAPANVAIGISRLKHKSGMVGAIGDDVFGEFLIRTLRENGVDTRNIVVKKTRTTLAFVMPKGSGEKEFFFYRKPWMKTADTELNIDDINLEYLKDARVLHFSGFAFPHPPASKVFSQILKEFSKHACISYDPNFKLDVWETKDKARNVLNEHLSYINFLSMGLDELEALFSNENYRDVSEKLLEKYGDLEAVAVRLGRKGAYVKTRKEEVELPPLKVSVVDTTGAGDAWTAGFIVSYFLEDMNLVDAVMFSNTVAAITCTKPGAIAAFPFREEVEEKIKETLKKQQC